MASRLFTASFRGPLALTLAALYACAALGSSDAADMRALFSRTVDRRLVLPDQEARRYAGLLDDALAAAGLELVQDQYLLLVDRSTQVQAAMVFFKAVDAPAQLIGASPASTGRPGRFDYFETPLGVFAHRVDNPDFRAEGTRNEFGVRGYGARGLRVYDFGWQQVPKGWGDRRVIAMRLQVHATDPDLLEPRLGSAGSKGCVRIPAALNRLLDRYGLLDADYERAQREGKTLWVLDPLRKPTPWPGRYMVVVDSARLQRPDWARAPQPPRAHPASVGRP